MMTNVPMLQHKINFTQLILKLTYGIVPIVAGADKFFNLLTNWYMYYNPTIVNMLPLTVTQFSYAVGIIEIVAGLLVLSMYTRYGAYVVSAWLVCISVSLIMMGKFYDIAVRDLVMAVGAFALAQLTEIKEG